MSFPRHEGIFRSDGRGSCRSGARSERLHAPTHRLDEFPTGYSLAGCAPAEPASASPAEEKFTMKAAPQPSLFQRMGKPCLAGCLTTGVHPILIGLQHGFRTTSPFGLLSLLLRPSNAARLRRFSKRSLRRYRGGAGAKNEFLGEKGPHTRRSAAPKRRVTLREPVYNKTSSHIGASVTYGSPGRRSTGSSE